MTRTLTPPLAPPLPRYGGSIDGFIPWFAHPQQCLQVRQLAPEIASLGKEGSQRSVQFVETASRAGCERVLSEDLNASLVATVMARNSELDIVQGFAEGGILVLSAILALSQRPSAGHSEPMESTRAPTWRLRRPVPEDRQALTAMIDRCSPEAIRQRFHGNRRTFPEAYLTTALGGLDGHFALVAEVAGGSIVALASCVATADEAAAEIAMLVEDSYQRQGIGSTMLRMLIAHADHRDIATLRATVLAAQEWILPLMRSFGSCSATLRMGVFDTTLRREKGRPAWIG